MNEHPPTSSASGTDSAVVRIDGEMTIYRAAELHQTFSRALSDRKGVIHFDLTDVSEIDSAGVQLLIAAKKTAQAARREMRLAGCSQAVIEILDELDLHGYFVHADEAAAAQP